MGKKSGGLLSEVPVLTTQPTQLLTLRRGQPLGLALIEKNPAFAGLSDAGATAREPATSGVTGLARASTILPGISLKCPFSR